MNRVDQLNDFALVITDMVETWKSREAIAARIEAFLASERVRWQDEVKAQIAAIPIVAQGGEQRHPGMIRRAALLIPALLNGNQWADAEPVEKKPFYVTSEHRCGMCGQVLDPPKVNGDLCGRCGTPPAKVDTV